MSIQVASPAQRVIQLLKPWTKEVSYPRILEILFLESEHFEVSEDRARKMFETLREYPLPPGSMFSAVFEALCTLRYKEAEAYLGQILLLLKPIASDPKKLDEAYQMSKALTTGVLGAKVWSEGKVVSENFDLAFPRYLGQLLSLLARTTISGARVFASDKRSQESLGTFSNNIAAYLSGVGVRADLVAAESARRARELFSQLSSQDFSGLKEGEGGMIVRDVMHKALNLLTVNDQVQVLLDRFVGWSIGTGKPLSERLNVYGVLMRSTLDLQTDRGQLVFASPDDALRFLDLYRLLQKEMPKENLWSATMVLEFVPELPEEGDEGRIWNKVVCRLTPGDVQTIDLLGKKLFHAWDIADKWRLEIGERFGAITFNWNAPDEVQKRIFLK